MTKIEGTFVVWKISRAPIGKLHIPNPLRNDRTICGHVIPQNALTDNMSFSLEIFIQHGCVACAWLFYSEMYIYWRRLKQGELMDALGVLPGDQR